MTPVLAIPILTLNRRTILEKDIHQDNLNILFDLAKDIPALAGARIAASIVFKNKIICVGFNSPKSHTFQYKYSPNPDAIYFHAENYAIYKAKKILSAKELACSTLYVCRVKYTNWNKKELTWGLAKPCSGCMEAIKEYNIKNVVYSLDGGGYNTL